MKTKYNKLQIVLEIIGAIILMAFVIFLISSWSGISEKIPAHYNMSGEVDRWGSKNEILILPIIGGILYVGLTVLTFIPKIWNVPTAKNEESKEAVYICIKTMVIILKVELIGAFFYIAYYSVNSQGLPIMFLPIELLVIFGTVIYFTVKSYKLSKQ